MVFQRTFAGGGGGFPSCSGSRRRPGFEAGPRPIRGWLLGGGGGERMAGSFLGSTGAKQLGLMLRAVAFFHSSEYVLAVAIHGSRNVNLSSLLVSKPYMFAMICSLLEYILEILLVPGLKELWWISNFGLIMVIIGELIRKIAILTAGRAFTHLIQIYFEPHNELVTYGIYSFVRHPGYCGFFLWATGTQIMLCNPICAIAFTLVTWKFFARRIPYEEFFLRQYFGERYTEYARRVPSGIPFVK